MFWRKITPNSIEINISHTHSKYVVLGKAAVVHISKMSPKCLDRDLFPLPQSCIPNVHPVLLPAVCLINCVDFSIFETIKIQNEKRQEFVFQCLWNSIRIIRNVIYLFLLHTILSKCMFWEWDNRKCFKNSWNFGEIKWINFTDFSFSKKFLDYTVLWIFEFSKIFFLHVNLLWKQCIKV